MARNNLPRVLFLLKQRHDYHYGHHHHHHHDGKEPFSSGLYNSARFASEMLEANGFKSKVVEVVDGNDIDREVDRYKPDITILEALWVTPEKLAENVRLHPLVEWIVRLHSEMPFLGTEGIAMQWVKAYWLIPHVWVAANTSQSLSDLYVIQNATVGVTRRMLLLPTYYPVVEYPAQPDHNPGVLRVICPGAIRPYKNQFTQSVAALRYCEDHGLRLKFYINGSREEQGGDAMVKNMVYLFAGTLHELHFIKWLGHRDFIRMLQSMDLGMQVSFSETFNICAADIVSVNVPLVASPQIVWSSKLIQADPTSTEDIAHKMGTALAFKKFVNTLNLMGLRQFSRRTERIWINELTSL